MEIEQAARAVAEVDARDKGDRAERLVELTELLVEDVVGFSGLAAQWLFEDVKATWIYGYFTATVLAAYAFCVHQLAGLIRMSSDGADLPDETTSLDFLAAAANDRRLIDLSLRAELLRLHDLGALYLTGRLREYRLELQRRAIEAEDFDDEHVLLTDARTALRCSVALLHRAA